MRSSLAIGALITSVLLVGSAATAASTVKGARANAATAAPAARPNASSGQSACRDLADQNLLIIAQGSAEVVSAGHHATNLGAVNADIEKDASASPLSLAFYLDAMLTSLDGIQARGGVGDTTGIVQAAIGAAEWCSDSGFASPRLGVD